MKQTKEEQEEEEEGFKVSHRFENKTDWIRKERVLTRAMKGRRDDDEGADGEGHQRVAWASVLGFGAAFARSRRSLCSCSLHLCRAGPDALPSSFFFLLLGFEKERDRER